MDKKFLSQERKRALAKLKAEIITEAMAAIKNQGKYNINIKITGRGYYIKCTSFGIDYKDFVEEISEELSKRLGAEVVCSENYHDRHTVVELRKET